MEKSPTVLISNPCEAPIDPSREVGNGEIDTEGELRGGEALFMGGTVAMAATVARRATVPTLGFPTSFYWWPVPHGPPGPRPEAQVAEELQKPPLILC